MSDSQRPVFYSEALRPGRRMRIAIGVLAYLIYITPPAVAWYIDGAVTTFFLWLIWPFPAVILLFNLAILALAPVWAGSLSVPAFIGVWCVELITAMAPTFLMQRYAKAGRGAAYGTAIVIYSVFAIGNLVLWFRSAGFLATMM